MMIAPRKILAIKFRALGDTVLLTAPLLELHRAYPHAEIDVAVAAPWDSILENHPAVHRIWSYQRHREATARARAIAALALKLRKEKYDTIVNFHASPSSSALAYALGAKVRSIHFHGHHDKNKFSTVTIPDKGVVKPIIERDMDALRALGLQIPKGQLPQIFLKDHEIESVKDYTQKLGLQGPLLCLGIGASRPTKIWPLDRFASVAIRWCDHFQGSVMIFNSEEETPLVKQLMNFTDEKLVTWYQDPPTRKKIRSQIFHLTQAPLRLMSAIMKNASLFLGNDSGPKHIAVASGIPTITLFGPEDPFEWHPYPKDRHPIHYIADLKCRNDQDSGMPPWCGLHTCVVEEHRCMKLIPADDVFRTIEHLMEPPLKK